MFFYDSFSLKKCGRINRLVITIWGHADPTIVTYGVTQIFPHFPNVLPKKVFPRSRILLLWLGRQGWHPALLLIFCGSYRRNFKPKAGKYMVRLICLLNAQKPYRCSVYNKSAKLLGLKVQYFNLCFGAWGLSKYSQSFVVLFCCTPKVTSPRVGFALSRRQAKLNCRQSAMRQQFDQLCVNVES